jgi:hypothetical protein
VVAFPQVQRKAQAEFDAVVGRDRLPTFADAPRLPYVRAIVNEVLHWRPTVPLGMDQAATEDHWYEGMFMSKGTLCTPNVWNCTPCPVRTQLNFGQSDTSTNTMNCYPAPWKLFERD